MRGSVRTLSGRRDRAAPPARERVRLGAGVLTTMTLWLRSQAVAGATLLRNRTELCTVRPDRIAFDGCKRQSGSTVARTHRT
jgi:hypothetical protein